MSLIVRNSYPSTVWVSAMWYHPNCPSGGNWELAGWWQLAPGEAKPTLLWDLASLNRYYAFYAEAANGATWSGPYNRLVSRSAYRWCEGIVSNDPITAGFRLLDIGGSSTFILNLVP